MNGTIMFKPGKVFNEAIFITLASLAIVVVFYIYITSGDSQRTPAGRDANYQTPAENITDQLNLLIWDEYVSGLALDGFAEKFGVKINITIFDDEEVMLSKILSERGKYDISIASGMYVAKMIDMKLLEPLGRNNIPNLDNINKKFINPAYDRGNMFSIPYMWGTTGLVINTEYVKEAEPDWDVLFNPEYAGHIAMVNDVKECFAVALKRKQMSLNTTDIVALREAADILLSQKDLGVRYLNEIDIAEEMLQGKIWAALTYSGHITTEISGKDQFRYILPQQGYCIWVDNLSVPINAANKVNAEKFINYLLDPEVSAEIASTYSMANTNAMALQFTDPDIVADQRIYPRPEVMELGESFSYQQVDAQVQKLFNMTWQSLYSE